MSTNANSSASKKVKFVASDPSRGGLPVKRKQVQQACDECRRKKRRCIHADNAVDDDDASDGSHSEHTKSGPRSRVSASVEVDPEAEVDLTGRRIGTNIPKTEPARFVGDLNPEGMFIEATAPAVARESAQKGDVGVWLPSSAFGGDAGMSSQFITSRPPAVMDQVMLPFVKEHCLTCLPPEEDFRKLRGVFIQKIHPIFPVVPITHLTEPVLNPTNIVLRQLVCLAACSDPDMAGHLRLRDNPTPLPPQEYSHTLSSSIRAILETSMITDRVLHIRALTILSLYTQATCPEEADLPAELGGRAIHHIQTLGLHLLRYDAQNCDDLNSLFCAVWAIDRINAAVYGRPCLIHERDVGPNFDRVLRRRPPAFRLLLNVVIWLDRVIELYRPGPSAEANGLEKVAYIDLPVLEAMIVEADALKVPSSLIATIETLYHAVIILSCRLPRPGTVTAASTLPPPSANARRSLAAERIACAVPRDCLSPVPFVPYAVSLALSVEYRKMRHSRLPMFRARAMNAFRRNCELLRPYRNHFWSANVVTGLGERVLKEMERAANTLSKDNTPPVMIPTSKAASSSSAAADAAAAPRPETISPSQTNGLPSAMDTVIDSAVGFDHNVDFSMVNPVSGQDVFGHIDPNFNLEAVEDALEANLDIGLPFAWGDWGHYAA